MEQRVVIFDPADIDRAAEGLERLLALDPNIGTDVRESYMRAIICIRRQLASQEAGKPVLNEVISAWTVEDIVDAATELESSGKGKLTCDGISEVAVRLRRNPAGTCWDTIYGEIRRVIGEKGDRHGATSTGLPMLRSCKGRLKHQ